MAKKCDKDNYDGSEALTNRSHEEIIQYMIANPKTPYTQISKHFERPELFITKNLKYNYKFSRRYQYLQKQLEKQSLITNERIIQGILAETQSSSAQIRLKAWELLGKSRAMFTEKRINLDEPKRIIIRSTNGNTTEIVSETQVDNPEDKQEE